MRSYHRPRLHGGEEEDRRRIARRGPAAHRSGAERARARPEARASTPTAASTWTTAIAYAKALSQYDLFWYEEPGDPLDYELQAELRNYYDEADGDGRKPVLDAGRAQSDPLRRHAPDRDWLQFDCALSYGLVEYLRTLDMLRENGWSPARCVPHGGHQMSLERSPPGLGLGGNESYPDLFQPYGGFPDGVKVENSYVTLPELPGIGFEGKSDLIKEMRALA